MAVYGSWGEEVLSKIEAVAWHAGESSTVLVVQPCGCSLDVERSEATGTGGAVPDPSKQISGPDDKLFRCYCRSKRSAHLCAPKMALGVAARLPTRILVRCVFRGTSRAEKLLARSRLSAFLPCGHGCLIVNYQRHFGQQRLSSTERMSIFEVRSRGR
jgi:hypothetical protein